MSSKWGIHQISTPWLAPLVGTYFKNPCFTSDILHICVHAEIFLHVNLCIIQSSLFISTSFVSQNIVLRLSNLFTCVESPLIQHAIVHHQCTLFHVAQTPIFKEMKNMVALFSFCCVSSLGSAKFKFWVLLYRLWERGEDCPF